MVRCTINDRAYLFNGFYLYLIKDFVRDFPEGGFIDNTNVEWLILLEGVMPIPVYSSLVEQKDLLTVFTLAIGAVVEIELE
jgi:hypothetical protein